MILEPRLTAYLIYIIDTVKVTLSEHCICIYVWNDQIPVFVLCILMNIPLLCSVVITLITNDIYFNSLIKLKGILVIVYIMQ